MLNPKTNVCKLRNGVLLRLFACFQDDEEENDICFALIVFLVSCDCKCFVPLPNDAVG